MKTTCTAHIAVRIDQETGNVTCKVCSYHVGHDMNLGHLRLSTEIRCEIAAQLQEGVTVSKIMDTMRDRLGDSLKRDNLLCRLVLTFTHELCHIAGILCMWHEKSHYSALT